MSEIKPYVITRSCESTFDTSKLALQDLKQINSHYSRKILQFQDADVKVAWSAADIDRYFPTVRGDAREFGLDVVYSLGLLLRYRMDWEPKGYGLGELLYSISLLPNEELTLEFKTWETDKRTEDVESATESKNTSDISSTNSDVREVLDDYNSKENFDIDAHAEASWGWGSASVDAGYSYEASEQHKTLTKTAREGTKKSVNELAQKRSVKITNSRESGSEDKTTRKIKNINQCHTLNVNYYQLLRQYSVSMYLSDVSAVVIGAVSSVGQNQVTRGTIYPKTIPEPPSIREMVASLRRYSLDNNPDRFQSTILRYCVPRPEIHEPDLYGDRRYVFEVIPRIQMKDDAESPTGLSTLLDYLYGFYTSASPPPEMKGMSVIASDLGSPRYRIREPIASGIVIEYNHFLRGSSDGNINAKVNEIKKKIIEEFMKSRSEINPDKALEMWNMAIPTYGIYAETMLGLCSGCEDYFEIKRQFDLEVSQQQLEKLKLEVEKLKLEKQLLEEGKQPSSVIIENPTDKTTINLDVGVSSIPSKVEIKQEDS